MASVDDQMNLELTADKKSHAPQPVTIESIIAQPNQVAANNLCAQVSGLTDKQIHMGLSIEKSQWSKIKSGQAHFPDNKYHEFMSLCGNEIPLIYMAFKRGKGLHDLEDGKDKIIRRQTEQIKELQGEIETLVKYGVIMKASK